MRIQFPKTECRVWMYRRIFKTVVDFFLFHFVSLSVTQIVLHLMLRRFVSDEFARVLNEMGIAYLKYYPNIFLEGLRKTRNFLFRILHSLFRASL